MQTFTKTFALALALIAFSFTAFAGKGTIVDINPSGAVAKVVDSNGQEIRVINKGLEHDIQEGDVILFDNIAPNGKGAHFIMTGFLEGQQ